MANANRSIKFKVPATSANLGPGFDCLAMALSIYDEVEMKFADGIRVSIKGEGEKEIPKDENNLMVKAVQHLCWRAGKPFTGLDLKVKKAIPLVRGQGSSAAAVVGGLYGANELLGRPYKKEELFNFATHLEGHPDNVAAAFFGGFSIAWMENGTAKCVNFTPSPDLKIILAVPNFEIYTVRARSSLPAHWPKEDVIFSLSHACLLVASLVSKKHDYLKSACQDRLHEPYRGKLIPGYEQLRQETLEAGANGVAISGSGPTVLAFATRNVDKIRKTMMDVFKKHKVKSTTILTKPSLTGVR